MDCLRSICCWTPNNIPTWEEEEINLAKSCDFYFEAAGFSIQHPQKRKFALGDLINADAFEFTDNILSVADGVSSVELEGFNSSLLPTELLKRIVCLVQSRLREPSSFDSTTEFPKHIVARACAECCEMGSTTVCAAILDGRKVRVANVGDSQMIQLRRVEATKRYNIAAYNVAANNAATVQQGLSVNETDLSSQNTEFDNNPMKGYLVVSRTKAQQHFFNCPFQLTRMPDVDCSYFEVLKRATLVTCVSNHDVQVGDIVIVGTDGVFDNLFDEDIVSILDRVCGSSIDSGPSNIPFVSPDVLAEEIINAAIRAAVPSYCDSQTEVKHRRRSLTPFAVAAATELGRAMEGGKPDDTSVVVGYVCSKSGIRTSKTCSLHNVSNERTNVTTKRCKNDVISPKVMRVPTRIK